MARFNHGALTRTKGKLGGIVFQQYEGMQIGKEYQPNVKNPNTPGQISTRARFALGSKINRLLYPFLSPVMKSKGIMYERFQRGQSLKQLMDSITWDSANEVAILNDMPNFKPNTSASEAITTDGITYSAADGFTFSGKTIANAPVLALFTFIPINGSPVAKVIDTTADANGDWEAISGADAAPAGFQGSVVGIAYSTEESDSLTGVTYYDMVGLSGTHIAQLGAEGNETTNLLLTNTVVAKAWQA